MKKNIIKTFGSSLRQFGKKHGPEIAIGCGVAGLLSTTVMAVVATPKVISLIEERKEELETEDLPATEIVKVAWKPYFPAAMTATGSVLCILFGTRANLRKRAAIVTAYQATRNAFSDYRAEAVNLLGEKKEKELRDRVAEKQINRDPYDEHKVIITGSGKSKCYDAYNDRYFESSIEAIKRAENRLYRDIMHDINGFVSLNDFYDEIGLPHVKSGNIVGWNVNTPIEISFSAQLADDDTPVIVMSFLPEPIPDYDKL